MAQSAVSIGTARFGNVFYADDAKQLFVDVDWPSGGAPGAAELALEVRGPYGEVVLTDTRAVDLTPGARAGFAVELGATANGLFAAEAVLRVPGSGAELARTAASFGVVPPLPPQDPGRSAIGYYVDPHENELALVDLIADQVASLGIRWVKLHYRWHDDRHERPDVGDPAWLDTRHFEAWVDAFHARGIRVLGQITKIARWASSQPHRDGPNEHGRGPIYSLVAPRDVADWALMVRTLATRLRGRVDAWEVGNEPEGRIYWMGSVEEFSDLVAAASHALHEVVPETPLVVNMVNTWDRVWAREMLDRVGPMLDAFGFHYATRDTVQWIKRDLLAPRGLQPAIWDTEAYGNTEVLGTDRMFTGWLEQRAAGTERLFHFVYHLPYFPTPESEHYWIARFGQFPVNADYTPRRHAFGLRTLSDMVGDKEFARDACVASALRGYTFRDGEKQAVLVLARRGAEAWSPGEPVRARFRLPRKARQIVVTDLMGNRETLSAGRRRRVDLTMKGVLTFVEGIDLRRVSRMQFKGYVGADGRFLRKRRARHRDYCDLSELGYYFPQPRR